jgi:hypothetical protein
MLVLRNMSFHLRKFKAACATSGWLRSRLVPYGDPSHSMQAYRGLRRVFRRRASCVGRRRVLDKSITYVGLDVHKDTIAVALAQAGPMSRRMLKKAERRCSPEPIGSGW